MCSEIFNYLTAWRLYRIYALTMKNKMVAGFFCGVTIPQLALGIYLITLAAINPGGYFFAERFPTPIERRSGPILLSTFSLGDRRSYECIP